MPTTVAELLHDKPRPVTAEAHEPLLGALHRMMEHDYSQLPVVDGDERPVALVSADGIMRALALFGVAPDGLRVVDAMTEHYEACRGHDDLLDVLDRLRGPGAMLVLGSHGEVAGVLTHHDTTEYFRRRAQDIMWVQDVEETVKQYVLAPFLDKDGARDEPAVTAAIAAITPSNARELRAPFRRALARYLELAGLTEHKLIDRHLLTAFDEHILRTDPPKPFEKLTLAQYIDLLLHRDRWASYEPIFQLEPAALRRLLVAVLDTRNDLAHFRADISEIQRSELRHCRDWLNHHEAAIEATFSPPRPPAPDAAEDEPRAGAPAERGMLDFSAPVSGPLPAAAADPADGRYAAIGAWLRARPSLVSRFIVSFRELDLLLEGGLPGAAREHRSWWQNRPELPHARQWLDHGWMVKSVSMHGELVTFVRGKPTGEA